jgi:NCS1 family nucleobase:cation symporter-1
MAILRYAKRVSYGFYSAFGMYLGHYLAWIGAGIMGAAAAHYLGQPLVELDAGAVAFYSLGVCGAIAVVIAGWTTSNPTMYRAGLALQAVTPGWPRWAVTLAAGLVTTVIACSPFVFTQLLNFVGIYGLLLMPIGTIVFMEHWIFPKIGLTRYWSSRKGMLFNWPALVSWAAAIGICAALWLTGTLHLFFQLIPAWIITAVLYTILAIVAGARDVAPEEDADPTEEIKRSDSGAANRPEPNEKADKENPILYWGLLGIAVAALASCVILPVWVFMQGQDGFAANFDWLKSALIWLTVIYFASGTVWAYTTDKTRA